MGDAPRDKSFGRLAGSLSASELGKRRAAWRRRLRHRGGVLLVIAGCAVAAAVATTGSSSKASHRTTASVQPGVSPGRGTSGSAGHAAGPTQVVQSTNTYVSAHVQRAVARLLSGNATAPYPVSGVENLVSHSGYIRLGGSARREVALTFDDGPSTYTPLILHTLERTHTPATFFTVGRVVPAFPHNVAREVQDGDVVGDHTESHAFLSEYSAAFQQAQIEDDVRAVERAGAPPPLLFRPPYGAFNNTTLGILHALGMAMVLWSVDTEDYRRPGVDAIVRGAVSGAQPGAVILMHDGGGDRSETAAALPRIIGLLRHRGYSLVTVPQLLADDPPPPKQPRPTPLSGAP